MRNGELVHTEQAICSAPSDMCVVCTLNSQFLPMRGHREHVYGALHLHFYFRNDKSTCYVYGFTYGLLQNRCLLPHLLRTLSYDVNI